MNAGESIQILLVQIGLILALSRMVGLIVARLRQPQVVGEMIAGIMLGPSVLGLAAPGVQKALFPAESVAVLHVLAELGVVFFLFLIGLEFDPKLIRKRGRAALLISASSIVIPFGIGVAMTYYLYPRVFNDPTYAKFTSAALFMGAAISITAFPVLARIIAERNLQKTTVGAISITGAAINDVLAWCMLALVVAVAEYDPGTGGQALGLTFALSLVYIAFMFFALRPSLQRLERIHATRGRVSPGVLAVIFMFIIASAYATAEIGIHALFGAFVMGLVMPKSQKFVRELTDKLEDFTVVFMLPIFFAYAGLSTDMRQIIRPDLLGFTLLIVLGAAAGKIGGTALASRVCGIGWRESTALGVLMNTRGLMELIILTIGLQERIINERIFAMMVVMALTTTAMTTPLLHWIYPAARFGGDEALAKASRRRSVYTVLVPVALPQSGPGLARLASALIGSGIDAGKVLALYLRRPDESDTYQSAAEPSDDDAAHEVLGPLVMQGAQLNLSTETITFASRDIPSDIAAVAKARGADLLLMGFHKPVFSQTILGGTVYRVMSRADTDVAILVDRGLEQIRRILVPFMGSSHDRLAMELANRMATRLEAAVTILHIVGVGDRTKLGARDLVERTFPPAQHPPVTFRVVEDESPVDVVLRESPGFDLVVIGVAEEWGLESRLIGLRPERIARECPASLLIVRAAPHGLGAAAAAPRQPQHQATS
jgi:Kef-type K+ transport system membrane component KefB/nucleotide-binding universal stress UspA family protein